MADEEKTTVTAEAEEGKDGGCPVEMYMGGRCGRAIYHAPAGVDNEPVCLMHSRNPNKDDAEFQAEFERILREAGEGVADFSGFVFPGAAYAYRELKPYCFFSWATFMQRADFRWATFAQDVHFREAKFTQGADFLRATFTQGTDFRWAKFTKAAGFSQATFKEGVNFRETEFREDEELLPGPVFVLTRFEKPDAVVFYQTYLGQALFQNCDVSKFTFSNVRWRERENGKRLVFEELVDLNKGAAGVLRLPEGSPDDRNYALIAELYQQLKKNYDDRRDYWTAGDFHYGEMEMKRLSSPRRNKLLRWLHRNLGLVAWYKYASEYGESYTRPALWMAVVVLLFTLLYPLVGLSPGGKEPKPSAQTVGAEQPTAQPSISYSTFFQFVGRDPRGAASGAKRFFGNSLMTTLGVAFFQRELEYQPVYPWGRVLQWAELLFTSTLIALFLLAVRRQFRR